MGDATAFVEVVFEGIIVGVFVELLMVMLVGMGLKDKGSSIPLRLSAPISNAKLRTKGKMASIHPVKCFGLNPNIRKAMMATKIDNTRWQIPINKASGQRRANPRGKAKPATAIGKRIS